jgi:hypothetical protein
MRRSGVQDDDDYPEPSRAIKSLRVLTAGVACLVTSRVSGRIGLVLDIRGIRVEDYHGRDNGAPQGAGLALLAAPAA